MQRPVVSLCAAAILAAAAATALASAAAPAAELPVEHSVVRHWERGGRLDLKTLKPVPRVTISEGWIDRERSRTRTVTRRDGIVVEDLVCAAPACSDGSLAQTDTKSRVLADLRAGKAHAVRTGVIRGRPVRWIRYGTSELFAFDAATYRMVRAQQSDHGRLRRTDDVLVDERLPSRDSDFVPHTPWPQLQGQSRPEGRLVQSGEAARAVPHAQWAGESAGGLKLNAIRERPWSATTKTGQQLSGTILHLRYGDWLGSFFHPRKRPPRSGVEITEASADSAARWWMTSPPGLRGENIPPPAGFTDIHNGLSSVKLGGSDYYPVAVLQKDGVWMIVRATSWPLLTKTLRSLKPIA